MDSCKVAQAGHVCTMVWLRGLQQIVIVTGKASKWATGAEQQAKRHSLEKWGRRGSPFWAVSKQHLLGMLSGRILVCQDVVRHHPDSWVGQGTGCERVALRCCCQSWTLLYACSVSKAWLAYPRAMCSRTATPTM